MRWRRFKWPPRAGGYKDQDPDLMADFERIYEFEAEWRDDNKESGDGSGSGSGSDAEM